MNKTKLGKLRKSEEVKEVEDRTNIIKRGKSGISIFKPIFETPKEKIDGIPSPSYDEKKRCVQEYIRQFGEEPSFLNYLITSINRG